MNSNIEKINNVPYNKCQVCKNITNGVSLRSCTNIKNTITVIWCGDDCGNPKCENRIFLCDKCNNQERICKYYFNHWCSTII
jgi:hypothetical protein